MVGLKTLLLVLVTVLYTARPASAASTPAEELRPDALTLEVVAEGTQIAVSQVQPGSAVALIGLARHPRPGAVHVVSWIGTRSDDDLDGAVSLDLDRPLPRKSGWAAVDLSNGAAGLAVPAGFPIRVERPGQAGFEIDPITGHTLVRLESELLRLLVVRPGAGAWSARAYDGGRGDTDLQPDGIIRTDPAGFEPLETEFGAFPGLASDDLIGAIDERTLTFYVLRGSDLPPVQ